MLRFPNFPTHEPMGGYTWFGVYAELSNGQERTIGEWQGSHNAKKAGDAALSAWRRYHGAASVRVLVDGSPWAYVTVNPRTHDKTPFLCQAGFCWHPECGQIPPEECGCHG